MFTDNLYNKVLIDPARNGSDELLIVCGYSSAAMIRRHLQDAEISRRMMPVSVVLGMTRKDGLPLHDHNAIVELVNASNAQTPRTPVKGRTGRLDCRYITALPDIHAKVYVWMRNGRPDVAYLGSANYSHAGFTPAQCAEAMDLTDPVEAHEFFMRAANRAVPCTDSDIDQAIRIFRQAPEQHQNSLQLKVPLYNPVTGDFEQKSGLNWGFAAPRKKGGPARDRNEAYIPLYREQVHNDFFPGRLDPHARFTIVTDDEFEFDASRGQGKAQGKAISTPNDNTTLGRYFRHRMGVPATRPFTRADCDQYGRHDVTFSKIDEDSFYMDFSVA